MTARVRLLRRFPPDERKRPLRDRKRWVWLLRWHESGGSLLGESVGFYAEARDDWRPLRGTDRRLTIKEAERARQTKQGELDNGTAKPRPSPTARMPWDEFKNAYLAETKGTVRDSTLKIYREAMESFARTVQPRTPVDVTSTMVKRYVQAMRDKGLSDSTIRKYIASHKRIWNDPTTGFAKRGNPFVLGRSIRLVCHAKEWHRYTLDEIRAVMGACPDLWWRTFIFTAYTTALRLGELVNLRWTDLDFDALELHVRPRSDDEACWEWAPKGKYRRTVALTGHTAAMLRHLSKTCDPGNPYAFIPLGRYREILAQRASGKWTGLRSPLNNRQRDYKATLRRAGVPVDAFHSLRKCCVTNWLEDGVPPHEVMAMAGHASVETTMKYYSKVDKTALNRVRAASERYTAGIVA